MSAFTVAQIVEEVASIAATLQDSPVFFVSKQVADGIVAMQQAAQRFAAATTNPQRLDAALWQNEAYLLFSSSLPDVGENEKNTGWATANQISKLFGGSEIWEQKCKVEFKGEPQ